MQRAGRANPKQANSLLDEKGTLHWITNGFCFIITRFLTSAVDITFRNKMIIDLSNAKDITSARQLFDRMPKRDVVTWNSMMTAYSRNEFGKEVLHLFSEMQRSHIRPNHTSFSLVLNSCGKIRALVQGRQIHGHSIKTPSSSNLFVTNAREVFDRMPSRNVVSWTALICGYVEAKKMRKAIDLFEIMPVRNHVSWSVMIGGFVNCRQFDEAFVFFASMLSSGVRPTVASILEVSTACSCTGNIKLGRKIHCYVIKFGFHLDHMIEPSLVSMYCECVEMEEAKLEFMKMEVKFIGSWNSLLCGYINSSINNNIDDARRCFDSMDNRDNLTWNAMINGYLKKDRLDDAMKLLWMMPEPTMETFTALMYSFIKNGNLVKAQKIFNMMPEKDIFSCTTLLFGYLEGGQLEDASMLFASMAEKNVVTYNVMISGLLHHGKMKAAYDLFVQSPVKDAVSWDSIIVGIIHNGLYAEAFQLYKKMALSEIRPSELITASLLRGSSKLSTLVHGEQIHAVAAKLGHDSSLIVGNSLINMYGKCGNMSMAKIVFHQMAEHDVIAWNAMIHSYACNGLGKEAIDTFEKMIKKNFKPDDVTFLGLLFACNHNFMWEEAHAYFNSMWIDYGIKPKMAHYACLIDLQCRMGMVEKAHNLAHSMPFDPDYNIWTSILSGCRLHGNVKIAEYAAYQLFSWDPFDRMPYKNLISIYVSAGRWTDVEQTKSKMNKITSNARHGCSWV